jgi:flagellar motor switch protein FliN/FliY
MADTSAVQDAPSTETLQAVAAAPATSAESSEAAPAATAVAVADAPEAPAQASASGQPAVDVRPARFPESPEQTIVAEGGQVDILLNTTMAVTASLGQVTIQVRHLLQLGPGSVVKLDRRVGEPIDLFLRGVKFATGQLVVVGEHLGVRIKEILPSAVAEGAVGGS